MSDALQALLARKRASAPRTPIAEITPSVRDFAYYCNTEREELAVVPLLARSFPSGHARWEGLDPAADAARLAAQGAYGIAVGANDPFGVGDDETLAVCRAAADVPVLRYDFVVSPAQLLHARALGADAVWLHAAALPADNPAAALTNLMVTVRSLHLDAVVGACTDAELDLALASPARLVGIHAEPLLGGPPDLEAARKLWERVPGDRAVVLFGGAGTADDLRSLFGVVDAVVVTAPLAANAGLGALIGSINDDA